MRFRSQGVSDADLAVAVAAHADALRRRDGVLKDEHKTAITRVCAGPRRAIVKQYRPASWRLLLKGIFRAHPGRRSVAAEQAMAARAVPAPRVLGLLERRRLGLVSECWLVMEEIAGAVEMDRYILRRFGDGADPLRRRRFVDAFARCFDDLMASGVLHRDLKTCNVLVVEDADDWRFFFIDLDDVDVRPAGTACDRAEWVLALAQLNPSTPKIVPRTDRMRFLRRLAGAARFPWKPLVADVQAESRRRRRAYFSDEGAVHTEFV